MGLVDYTNYEDMKYAVRIPFLLRNLFFGILCHMLIPLDFLLARFGNLMIRNLKIPFQDLTSGYVQF